MAERRKSRGRDDLQLPGQTESTPFWGPIRREHNRAGVAEPVGNAHSIGVPKCEHLAIVSII